MISIVCEIADFLPTSTVLSDKIRLNMYTVHLDLLRIIHKSTCIAVIFSRLLNNMCSMFNFLGRQEKLTLVAVMLNFLPCLVRKAFLQLY